MRASSPRSFFQKKISLGVAPPVISAARFRFYRTGLSESGFWGLLKPCGFGTGFDCITHTCERVTYLWDLEFPFGAGFTLFAVRRWARREATCA
jgi:hypothetical protein